MVVVWRTVLVLVGARVVVSMGTGPSSRSSLYICGIYIAKTILWERDNGTSVRKIQR